MPGWQGLVDRFKPPMLERVLSSTLVLIVQTNPENPFEFTLEFAVPRQPAGDVYELSDRC